MFKFSIKNLLTRKSKFIMTGIAILVASLIILFSYNVANQINEGIVTTATYYDLVVGPNGSSTDLVMDTMFFTGTSTGTIDSSVYESLKANRDVRTVIPFASGDNYNGHKIVGTSNQFLADKKVKEGKLFDKAFEVTIGYDLAEKYNLKIGDKIYGMHGASETGHKHENNPYTIVGILSKTYTSYDTTVFTTVDSVWKTHEHHEEGEEHDEEDEHDEDHDEEHEEHIHEGNYTALLVKTKSPLTAVSLISDLNKLSGVQAANPSTVLRDLMQNINIAAKIVYVLCVIIGVMSFIIICMITLMMMQDLKKDITLMRLLGLKRKTISGIIFIQNFIVIIFGVLLAFILTRVGLMFANNITASMGIVMNYTKIYFGEYIAILGVIVISLLPTIFSLIKMFRSDLGNEK